MASRRRGRPLKFGRPGQSVTVTLPADVVAWLHSLHEDMAWAIVGLFEHRHSVKSSNRLKASVAELVQLPGRRALILVRPEMLRQVSGVAVVPLSDGRAFIALESGGGVADLELAVLDRLDSPGVSGTERAQLVEFRQLMREWRKQGLRFQARSILIVERQSVSDPARSLTTLATTG